MGRIPRRSLGHSVYHVFNRASNNQWILDKNEDKNKFFEIMEKLSRKYTLNIYHYCIMSNHFHLAIEGEIKQISSFISGLSSQYSKYYHGKYANGFGSIWQGRYKSVIVQKEAYLARLGRYIELNPVRANIVTIDKLLEYQWNSCQCYLLQKENEIIDTKNHPIWSENRQYAEKQQIAYQEYLQMPYDDDIVIFRKEVSKIGDEAFCNKLIKALGHIKLRAGRPRKGKKE